MSTIEMSEGDGVVGALAPAERRALALVGLMLRLHGGRDGEGLFSGVSRYAVLEQRLRLAAERSRTIRQLWDLTARMMRWGIGPQRHDAEVLALIAAGADERDVLRALADNAQSLVMIARHVERQRRAAETAAGSDEPEEGK